MKDSVRKTCVIGPPIGREQFIAEHVFVYVIKGRLQGSYGGRPATLSAGCYGLVRKNRLGNIQHANDDEQVQKVIVVLDEAFLRIYQVKYKIGPKRFDGQEPFLELPAHQVIADFINSLLPYYDIKGGVDQPLADIKREELLLVLLKLYPVLSGVLFDFGTPHKINLEEFMNRNYRYNVSIQRFAFLTGRSLSAFKRDFKLLFNQTPGRWLVERRLMESKLLIEQQHKRPSEIYLDLGFESLAHFSVAFKKQYQETPTDTFKRSGHYP